MTGSGEVVIQVVVGGGFVPIEVAVTTVPTVTVLGDGTVITPAPAIAIYPGPAIAPQQSTRIVSPELGALVDRARTLGLLAGPLDFGRPPVADAPDTTVTIVAGSKTYRHQANALGIADEGFGIDRKAAENRRALGRFVAALEALPPGQGVWTPGQIAVYALGPYQADPQLPQPSRPWPLAKPPATSGTAPGGAAYPCTLVSGGDVAALQAALAGANSRTPWTVEGRQLALAFRPVLPGQPGC